ncbi:MAG: hypothetical protein CL678_05745 [Bdellovibrionaceae bacterium]|nr:hypothetical protein [Pseudobdellovibrionaceae bacterium]
MLYKYNMRFSKKSKQFIKYFFEHFEKLNIKKDKQTQHKTDQIFLSIYNDIKNCQNYVNILERRHFIQGKITRINKISEIPKTNLLHTRFMPSEIKKYIEKQTLGYFKFDIMILNIKTTFVFLVFDIKQMKKKMNEIEKKIKKAIKIIRFCSYYMKKDFMSQLFIYLFLTPINKEMPKSQLTVLGEKHCNSAVTFACQEKGEILIFREEEWEKVLIHETMHAMCLDFSGMDYLNLKNKMKNIFKIKSDFEISESYTESWATILNCCFISYNLIENEKYKKKNNKTKEAIESEDNETEETESEEEKFILYTECCLQFERFFSLFQCIKILNHMGLRYTNLYKNNDISKVLRCLLYKENTDVLSYYIIKAIILYNYEYFLLWCKKNNLNTIAFDKNPNTLKKIGLFIKNKYKNEKFLKDIHIMETIYNDIIGTTLNPDKKDILATSRMTISELGN